MSQLSLWPSVTDDDGSLTAGTVFNKTLTDAIKAAIEDETYSPAYPTTSPADIIDEVAAARGSASSLSDRLDASLAADGSFLLGIIQRLTTDLTQYSTVNAALTNLAQYVLTAGTLANNGQLLRVTAYGILGANANVKIIRFVFGATSLIFNSSVINGGHWRAQIEVYRVDGTNQLVNGSLFINGQASENVITAAPAETLSNAITLGFKGQGTVSSDVVQKAMVVEFLH